MSILMVVVCALNIGVNLIDPIQTGVWISSIPTLGGWLVALLGWSLVD